MKALIKKELRLSRKFLLIWMGIVLLLCCFAYFEYLSMRNTLGELAEMMNAFPKILMIMFGIGEKLDSALGWHFQCCKREVAGNSRISVYKASEPEKNR